MTDESQVTEQPEESVDVDALQADRDQLFDRLQRLAAEFDNFRKRNAREQAAFAERANERLVKELIPILDDLGLEPALNWLARSVEESSGMAVVVEVEPLPALDGELQTLLFRIAQEALTNANKYARASHVKIDLKCLDGHVRLRVRDDGVGFDPGSIPEREEPGRAGLGIFGMRERATLLRGTLEIHSAPLKGTEVVAQLPLEDRHAG